MISFIFENISPTFNGILRNSGNGNYFYFYFYCKYTDSEDEVDSDVEHDESKSGDNRGCENTQPREFAASVPNLNNKSPHNKRRGMSETPEIQRKSRKLFAARTRDVDKLENNGAENSNSKSNTMARKRRSLTNPRSSIDESESSRKSSMSSGRNKNSSKQFAVTLLVNENDKTKIMDMLHKAKAVISRKVEKVMGRKPPKSEISNAEALRTVLENWVEDAEKQEKDEENEEQELIDAQDAQMASWKSQGYDPPVHLRPIPTTIVSPVPEEDDEILDDEENDCFPANEDIEVQEVLAGQTSFLLPPKAQKFKLERSSMSPQPMSPARSLTPCDNVPRPIFMRQTVEDNYKLRRPSSHYDASAQAACSRPTSRQDLCLSPAGVVNNNNNNAHAPAPQPPAASVFDYSAFAKQKAFQDQQDKMKNWFMKNEYEMIQEDDNSNRSDSNNKKKLPDGCIDRSSTGIQRPESMIIPIGGVWRPDEDEPVSLFEPEVVQQHQPTTTSCQHTAESHSAAEEDEENQQIS